MTHSLDLSWEIYRDIFIFYLDRTDLSEFDMFLISDNLLDFSTYKIFEKIFKYDWNSAVFVDSFCNGLIFETKRTFETIYQEFSRLKCLNFDVIHNFLH